MSKASAKSTRNVDTAVDELWLLYKARLLPGKPAGNLDKAFAQGVDWPSAKGKSMRQALDVHVPLSTWPANKKIVEACIEAAARIATGMTPPNGAGEIVITRDTFDKAGRVVDTLYHAGIIGKDGPGASSAPDEDFPDIDDPVLGVLCS